MPDLTLPGSTWALVAGWGWAAGAVLLGLAAVVGLVEGAVRRPTTVAYALAAAAGVAITAAGLGLVGADRPLAFAAGDVLGLVPLDVVADRVSGAFLVAFGPVAAAASLFAIGYERQVAAHDPDHLPTAALGAAFPLFLLSLVLVFTAGSAFAFLVAWEGMALASALLVIGRRPDRGVLGAGYVYLATTHLATAAIVVAFALLATLAGGSLGFDAWRGAAAGAPALARDAAFLLAVVGFGTKAGAMPFHFWLPRAHAAAPSHVSALMSGVMLNAGIYGIVRIGIDVLGAGADWWGVVLLVVGGISAVLGILYALMERDLKRLLAFSSIENVGIVLTGLGAALVLRSSGADVLATLVLSAALLHVVAHGYLKAALFLGAGSVLAATGLRDLDRLGGLARRMPVTALAFGVAALGLAGLPPLLAFVSEWGILQGLIGLAGWSAAPDAWRLMAAAAIGGLALTAALALAAGAMAVGMAFLALPRSIAAEEAAEVGRSMRAGPLGLAGLVLAASVAAAPVASVLAGIVAPFAGPPSGFAPPIPAIASVPGDPGAGRLAPSFLLLMLVVIAGVVAAYAARRRAAVRRVPTWTGGIIPTAAMEYTATSYAKPLRLFFRSILRPSREVRIDVHPGTPFPHTITYRSEYTRFIDRHVLGPIHTGAVRAAGLVRRLQNGSVQLYVGYVVVALVVLLVLAR